LFGRFAWGAEKPARINCSLKVGRKTEKTEDTHRRKNDLLSRDRTSSYRGEGGQVWGGTGAPTKRPKQEETNCQKRAGAQQRSEGKGKNGQAGPQGSKSTGKESAGIKWLCRTLKTPAETSLGREKKNEGQKTGHRTTGDLDITIHLYWINTPGRAGAVPRRKERTDLPRGLRKRKWLQSRAEPFQRKRPPPKPSFKKLGEAIETLEVNRSPNVQMSETEQGGNGPLRSVPAGN